MHCEASRGETPIFLFNLAKINRNELFKNFVNERLTQTPIKIVDAVGKRGRGGEEENCVSEEIYL